MPKRGFILIECCVYLVICAMLTLVVMQWLTQTMYEAGRTTQIVDNTMMNMLVHDVFMRDLQLASSDRSSWVKITPEALIWQKNKDSMVGWFLQNKQLIRKEGTYSAASDQWGKHHTSIVAYGVILFACDAHISGDRVQAIKSTIALQGTEPSSRFIRIRNGVI